ncbi:S1 RNA binding domain protein [Staphylococcus aureus]|uniref:S1 RNA binding domain protein n=1 Tax=Staphylococcus aureus TaxID=1280 RepID=A0A2X2JW77_STAAU|nr:S1 RNA binding domain protein [Staphylococcus aureus]
MALDKDIVGSIEFLEVVGLQGSTYLLKGPNGENVKLNQSEMNDDDELEVGEEYSFFIYPNRSGELFATQICLILRKINMILLKYLKRIAMGHV